MSPELSGFFVATVMVALSSSALGAGSPTSHSGGTGAGPGIPATSVGPRSDAEAEYLWKTGSEASEKGDCAEAARSLSRFVARYPGHSGYLQAHFLLGSCQLQTGETAAAIRSLRFFVSGSEAPKSPVYLEGKLLLGRALLKVRDPAAALLVAQEIERDTTAKNSPLQNASLRRIEGLYLKTLALADLGELLRARKAMDAARALLAGAKDGHPTGTEGDMVAQAEWTELRLNSRECQRYPSREKMDEAQARDQLDRRGDCELKGLQALPRVLAASSTGGWLDRVAQEVLASFQGFAQACATPPEPLPVSNGKPRTADQLRKYRAELAAILSRDCASRYREAVELLSKWKSGSSKEVSSLLDRISDGLGSQAATIRPQQQSKSGG